MIKKIFSVLIVLLLSNWACGESNGSEHLQQVTFDPLYIDSDSFPKVSVQFKVEAKNGDPVWELREDQVQVTEAGKAVLVEDFCRLSDNWNIKLGLVIDHSGSMYRDMSILLDSNSYHEDGGFKFDETYQSPLKRAKTAIGSFLGYFDWTKDSAQVVGFGTTVDPIRPYTNVEENLYQDVHALEPIGLTAYYDALYAALGKLKNKNGPRIIIALTDGQDNRSKKTPIDVIKLANQIDVPIYSIALGDKDLTVPQRLGWKTGGAYYFAETAHDLNRIYRLIAKRILSTYQVTFLSRDRRSENVMRHVQVMLEVDTIHLLNNSFTYEITDATIEELKVDEDVARIWTLSIYGSVALISLILMLVVVKKRVGRNRKLIPTNHSKTLKPVILKVSPNPIVDKVEVVYDLGESPIAELVVTGKSGKTLYNKKLTVPKGTVVMNFSKAKSKHFLFVLIDEDGKEWSSTKVDRLV